MIDEEKAKTLRDEFIKLTGIDCKISLMGNGEYHKPTTLRKDEQGVYVFFNENYCFKVGKAGSKSKARWNSHHYNLDNKTPSTFAKSIMKNKEKFKQYYPKSKYEEINNLKKDNIKQWIRDNTYRIEFKISADKSKYALNLLEALLQFRLEPVFEGKYE